MMRNYKETSLMVKFSQKSQEVYDWDHSSATNAP